MPEQVWAWQGDAWFLVSSNPGNPAAIYAMCQQAGMTVSLQDIEATFNAADVTQQEPSVAYGRLGLQIVQASLQVAV